MLALGDIEIDARSAQWLARVIKDHRTLWRTPVNHTELVNESNLEGPSVRKKLMEGGEAAVAASENSMIVLARKLDPMRREFGAFVRIGSLCVIRLSMAGAVGCSANPYYGSTPAPPDRLHAFIPHPPVTPMAEAMSCGTTGSVPVGDGSEDIAPNYSGYIPPLGNQ